MSIRLFVGYFLVLAVCATLAFAPTQADSPAPPMTAGGGLVPMEYRSGSPSSFHARPYAATPKRSQIAEAE